MATEITYIVTVIHLIVGDAKFIKYGREPYFHIPQITLYHVMDKLSQWCGNNADHSNNEGNDKANDKPNGFEKSYNVNHFIKF